MKKKVVYYEIFFEAFLQFFSYVLNTFETYNFDPDSKIAWTNVRKKSK